MAEMAIFNVQSPITPKVDKPELRFMCSSSRLRILYICVKCRENIERAQVYNVCSAHCLAVILICVKFPNNISNGFQLTKMSRSVSVMERTRMMEALTDGLLKSGLKKSNADLHAHARSPPMMFTIPHIHCTCN